MASSSASAADQERPWNGATIFLMASNRHTGDGEPVRLDFAETSFSEIPDIISSSKQIIANPKQIVVDIYLPKGMEAAAEADYLAQIRQSLQSLSNEPAKIQLHYVEPDQLAEAARLGSAEVRAASQIGGSPSLDPNVAKAMIEHNGEVAKETSRWSKILQAANTRTAATYVRRVVAPARGVIAFAMLMWQAGSPTSFFNFVMSGVGAATWGVEYHLMTKYNAEYGDFARNHKVPLHFFPFNIYNRLSAMKAMIFSYTVWNLFFRNFMLFFLSAGNPEAFANPLMLKTWTDGAAVGLGAAYFGGLAGSGIAQLSKQGYITGATERYYLYSMGLLGQASFLIAMMQTQGGNVASLPVFLGVTWGASALTYMAAKVVPVRAGSHVFIHPTVASEGRREMEFMQRVSTTVQAQGASEEFLRGALAEYKLVNPDGRSFWSTLRERWELARTAVGTTIRNSCERLGFTFGRD